jgi:hypothetical protein
MAKTDRALFSGDMISLRIERLPTGQLKVHSNSIADTPGTITPEEVLEVRFCNGSVLGVAKRPPEAPPVNRAALALLAEVHEYFHDCPDEFARHDRGRFNELKRRLADMEKPHG